MADQVALLRQAGALRQAGRFAEAERAYVEALRRWPHMADSWYNLGYVQRQLGKYDAALHAYQQAIDRGASQPEEIRLNRAVIFADHVHDDAAAERELREALRLSPRYLPALLNLGNLQEDRGQRGEARACYERVLELAPRDSEALARLANVSSFKDASDPLIARLQAALDRPDLAAAEKASAAFALGRALDSTGAFGAAFGAYTRANAFSRASFGAAARYDRAAQERFIDRIIAAFPQAPAPSATHAKRAPVFICGMFRSGSTLTEQILAGHPRITAGGELAFLPRLVQQRLAPFPEAAARLDAAAAAQLAGEYRAMLERSFPGADLVTDKRPDNFLYIGLIKRLFPEAKIVHTVRHPLDNILSIYFLHLDPSMSYALDLEDAAHYYREYRRLMRHWKKLFGDDILDVSYDDLVRNPEAEVGALLAFLGLEWSDACLAFQARKNSVKTASVWQVREPLYQRASGRWRHYATQLAPAAAYLEGLLPTQM
ncbi:MAG: sulfotransferase [Hyphomonadaceae bacterium]|nr:sulfotransferase [Hyphomonadaceae bacterium]